MKKTIKSISLFIVLGLAVLSCKKEEETITNLEEIPVESELNAVELEMLHYMMEEEKLAYDVYVTLYDIHGITIFNNISKSETSHIEAVNKLLTKYNITNTASSTRGVYNIDHIQELYDALIAKGSTSVVEALTVGAIIEDVDIYDLEEYLGKTSNKDIQSVFEFLNCGSRNHMRGFIAQLDLQNANYTPQYITQDHFDEIIDAGHEVCGGYTID